MSLILDALRKSEQERRQADPPVLLSVAAEAAALPPRRLGPLPVASVIVVATAVLVLAWVYQGGREAQLLHAVAPAVKPAALTAPPPAAPETTNAPREVPQAPELKPNPFVAAARRDSAVVRDLAKEVRVERPEPEPPVHWPPPPRAAAPTPVAAAPPKDAVKFLRALPPEFQRTLPELVVNIHIYAPREADRILYINNRQFRAGDKVGDGIIVEEIVEDGAVLTHHGRRFKLPRPS